MQDYNAIRQGEELDWGALENYLREALPEVKGAFSVAQFHGGHANLTYLIRFGDQELVLRRPPFGKIAPGAHDMRREYKVLSTLNAHFPAAPRAFHLCTDPTVIGADFVVMERRTGIVIRTSLPDCFAETPKANVRLTDALMRCCADLHLVDTAAAGLSDLGKPDGFTARQLRGWEKRWHLSKTAEDENMDVLFAQLAEDIPVPQRVSIVHGDLKFDNCQFQPEDPDRVTSVFDWDMATLGDPLVDLAGLLSFWPDPRLGKMPAGFLQGDWPDKAYLKERYAEYSGLDLSRMAWYEGLAYAKTAVIAQQLYARYVAGATKDKRMEKFELAARAFAQLGRASFPGF
ncbi:MAG: phosphotransferase family protein [Bacteroidota bacterium]